MILSEETKKNFWDQKIRGWDADRYGAGYLKNKSIVNRVTAAVQMMRSSLTGAHVIELGCGTGRSIELLKDFEIKSYKGFDFSKEAIALAKDRALASSLDEKFNFFQAGVDQIQDLKSDLVFSLGLFDWLSDAQCIQVLSQFKGAAQLHSFSKSGNSFSHLFHKFYVFCSYGYKNQGYVPCYRSDEQILSMCRQGGLNSARISSPPKTSFGAFVVDAVI